MYQFRLKFHWSLFPTSPIDKIQTLVQIMAWRQPGHNPLSEPMMIILLTHICLSPSHTCTATCRRLPCDWKTAATNATKVRSKTAFFGCRSIGDWSATTIPKNRRPVGDWWAIDCQLIGNGLRLVGNSLATGRRQVGDELATDYRSVGVSLCRCNHEESFDKLL